MKAAHTGASAVLKQPPILASRCTSSISQEGKYSFMRLYSLRLALLMAKSAAKMILDSPWPDLSTFSLLRKSSLLTFSRSFPRLVSSHTCCPGFPKSSRLPQQRLKSTPALKASCVPSPQILSSCSKLEKGPMMFPTATKIQPFCIPSLSKMSPCAASCFVCPCWNSSAKPKWFVRSCVVFTPSKCFGTKLSTASPHTESGKALALSSRMLCLSSPCCRLPNIGFMFKADPLLSSSFLSSSDGRMAHNSAGNKPTSEHRIQLMARSGMENVSRQRTLRARFES
mmetsp:Transcript_76937/g.152337  ORF Transcript_76937/g.152337 Transcript_76937/m.152337 type:complete len:283 (+) Transcript_76937:1227-2075(+)